ncbi:GldG family protein [bacterium]|nr:GldG family protein [bacterium]
MNRTLFFFLTLFGVVLLLVGGMSYVVFREVNLAIGALLGVGAALLLAGLFLNYQEVSRVARGRSAAKAFNAMIETVIVLAIVGFLYAIAVQYPNAKTDLTKNKRLSLAPQTVNVLRNLDKQDKTVTITACITADSNFMIPVETLLRKYRDVSSRLEYRIVDFVKNPAIRQELGERVDLGTTFVKCGGKQERIEWPLSQEKLTNAILKVIREETTKVYFTEGHGELPLTPDDPQSGDSYAGLKAALEDQTFIVASLNIAAQEHDPIPEDCDILVVAGPASDFYPPEVEAIRKYLRRGGKALFLIDPPLDVHDPGAKSLHPVFAEYGIAVEQAVVVEVNQLVQMGLQSPLQPICKTTGDSPIVRGLSRAAFVLPVAVPLNSVNTAVYRVTTTPLLETSERSWGEKDFAALSRRGATVSRDEESERSGPLTVAIASEAEVLDATDKADGRDATRIVVVGDSDAFTTGSLRPDSTRPLAQNIFTWLSKYDDQIGIPPLATEDSSLILDQAQKAIVLWIPTAVLPGVVLLAAVIVLFLRRRYA